MISNIKKILVISLTNIGDVVLTFPVIDVLRRDFPDAELSVVVGPKGEPLFTGNSHLKKLYVYNKRQPTLKIIQWVWELRRQHFDLVVDLRNTAIPFLIGSRYTTSLFLKRTDGEHMRVAHLRRLKSVYPFRDEADVKFSLHYSAEDIQLMNNIIADEIGQDEYIVVVSPGAADHKKKWTEEGFVHVCDELIERHNVRIVFVGDRDDRKVVLSIMKKMQNDSVNLSGRITLQQLARLFTYSKLAIVNDSAPMHLASYLDVPVLALFGPSDPRLYGPWSSQKCFIKKNQTCEACQNSASTLEHVCMSSISSDDVLNKIKIKTDGVVLQA